MKLLTTLIFFTLSAGGLFAAAPRSPQLGPVGPSPDLEPMVSQTGTLQVFSAPQQRDLGPVQATFFEGEQGDVLFNRAHTDYTIYNLATKTTTRVRNAHDADDETPTVVSLAPGSYLIKARDTDIGSVTVPVVIKAGEPTVVNLQGDWRSVAKNANKDEYVWYGNSIVGWKAGSGRLTVKCSTRNWLSARPESKRCESLNKL